MIDSVSFFFHNKKQDVESMVAIVSFITDYFFDQEDGICWSRSCLVISEDIMFFKWITTNLVNIGSNWVTN